MACCRLRSVRRLVPGHLSRRRLGSFVACIMAPTHWLRGLPSTFSNRHTAVGLGCGGTTHLSASPQRPRYRRYTRQPSLAAIFFLLYGNGLRIQDRCSDTSGAAWCRPTTRPRPVCSRRQRSAHRRNLWFAAARRLIAPAVELSIICCRLFLAVSAQILNVWRLSLLMFKKRRKTYLSKVSRPDLDFWLL